MSLPEKMKKIYLYSRFERFWHWIQTLMILLLILTGYEVHGSFPLFGFKNAVEIHNTVAWSWVILYVFILFWMVITNEWKQYVPTTRKVMSVIRYYMIGIFRGEPHPVPKSERAKHNPLQRLTYLAIAVIILPVQMATGLIYYYYNNWASVGLEGVNLNVIAYVHMAGAFAILAFLIVHVYMTTTGHSVWAHIRAMFTGWEEIPDTEPEPEQAE